MIDRNFHGPATDLEIFLFFRFADPESLAEGDIPQDDFHPRR